MTGLVLGLAISVFMATGIARATTPTPTPTQRHCATTTPEPLSVDPIVSPTDELTQTIYVRAGNADHLEISSEAGTFVGRPPFDRVEIPLVPNTANHLRVTSHVRRIVEGGCTYGDYTLTTTTDLHGAPLTIVQGTMSGPTIAVEPPTITVTCNADFEIGLRNASESDDVLEISFVSLHHAYSQGDYGTDFTWDTGMIELPLALSPGELVTIPVWYRGTGPFDSRLVLQVFSNARNNQATQYLAYKGKICATPTPTSSFETPTPSPTATVPELCPPLSRVAPPSGPPGSVVAIQGTCYPMHSGRSADVFLDEALIAQASGETGGNFLTLVRIPMGLAPGEHFIRLMQYDFYNLTSGSFEVVRAAGACEGDCNQDGRVDVSEVVAGLGIALEELPPDACPGFDSEVKELKITDIIAAVRNALEGCPVFPALESFDGAYEFLAGSESELDSPSGVGRYAGQVGVHDGALDLELEYLLGWFDLVGTIREDGSVRLRGVFAPGEGTVDVSGSALLHQTDGGEWIGGELVFDPPGSRQSETLLFSMQRLEVE